MSLCFHVVGDGLRESPPVPEIDGFLGARILSCLSLLPHDYSLITGQREYRVPRVVILEISGAVSAQDRQDQSLTSFEMDRDISEEGMRRFVYLLDGYEEPFTRDTFAELEAIGASLQFSNRVLGDVFAHETLLRPGHSGFALRLDWGTLASLFPRYPMMQVITNHAQYTFFLPMVLFSPVLRAHFDAGSYRYDFDDEDGSFDSLRRYLICESFPFLPSRLDSLSRIASDLEVAPLERAILLFRERQQREENRTTGLASLGACHITARFLPDGISA
jgi:hypothetical protein